ncbi:MAG: Plug domain-containing protein, partial [Candidatus Babeliales bacterium]
MLQHNKWFFLTVFFMWSFGLFAQKTITVHDDKAVLPYVHAHFYLLPPSENQEWGYLSNQSGELSIPKYLQENPKTRFVLKLSHLGFESYQDTFATLKMLPNQIALKADEAALQEVVVSAQYLPTSTAKTVHKVEVIDAEKINNMAAVNLRDLLSNNLNIRLSQDNILGSSMSMQGLSGENVKIMIDGVPIIGRQNGNIDLSQINLNNIERVELVEGPLAVNYGSNALAGTLNIITKKRSMEKYSVYLN